MIRVAPISGDLLVKLALLAGAGLGAWMLLQKAKAAVPSFPEWDVDPTWQWVNPASDENLAYQGTNAVVSAATGRDETLGGWFYDLTHPDPVNSWKPPPVNTGGATGGWDYDAGYGPDATSAAPYFGA